MRVNRRLHLGTVYFVIACILDTLALIRHGRMGTSLQLSELVENLLSEDPVGGTQKYNSRVRPGIDSGVPIVVWVNLYVTEIYRISEANMEYSMTFYLRQRWVDERLTYTAYNNPITLNYNQFNKIWAPDLFFRNLKSGSLHEITVPNRLIRLYPNGTLLFSQRLSVTLACDMYLERYPMDNQTCTINIGSYAYTTEDLIIKWDTIKEPVEINPKITFPKFDFTGVIPYTCEVSYTSTGAYPCIEAQFKLERRLKSYVLYIYLPSLLVVVLSWVSFWIDLQAVPARISLGILTILTITTQSVGVNRNMPSVSLTKAIDVWMVSCLVFVFASFLEYSVVNVLARKQNKQTRRESYTTLQDIHPRNEEKDIIQRKGSLSTPLDGDSCSTNLRQRVEATSYCRPTACCCVHHEESPLTFIRTRHKPKRNNALTVDIVSRILFPLLFMVFNILYWPLYVWNIRSML
ncbi:hypothetical protein LSH36_407g01041 [Paralvinella palmiformis]|uniref:Uncharacterized protein n=1 Tax=Paralvinella palmiformis TaxID=53620 RepID=A0AAD9N0D1_9ANNE|nr:hypothetical protein LSH36_407g01041 [Paralvinella palmiformis]